MAIFPSSLAHRIVIGFVGLSLATGLLSSWEVFRRAEEQQLQRIRSQLEAVAATAAVSIDGDAFAQLRHAEQQGDDIYRHIQTRLDRVRDSNEDIRFVYTMRLAQGEVSFVVDAPAVDFDGNGVIDEDEEMATLGSPYPEAASMPALVEGFERPSADPELTTDRWGSMLSGYAPILDSSGQAVGLVGVDMMAGRLDQLRHAFLRSCSAVVLAVALAALVLSTLLSWRLVRPVRAMQRELGLVEQGTLERIDDSLGDDELRSLAEAFNALLDSRRRMEGKLQEGAKLEVLAQLSAAMAHDFANHLTVIRTTAELMMMDTPEDAPERRRLERIERAVQGAAAETRRLLGFARQSPEQRRALCVHEQIRAAVELVRSSVGRSVELATSLDAPETRILGDAFELRSALLNLALNARDAMPDGGVLTIRTAAGSDPAQPGIRIEVQDEGTGMSPEVLGRIFEPFFTTKPEGKGTGLGMLAVRTMAESHGACLEIDSEPGRGTTVSMSFPLLRPPADESHDPA